jgi:mannonate dehydratase
MLGLPGREEQLENMKSTVRAMGEAGVPILGMHWMPQIVWRTDMGHFGRGGAYVSIYDHSIVMDRTRDSEIWVARRDERDVNLKDTFTRGSFVKLGVETLSVDQMWANFEYFIKIFHDVKLLSSILYNLYSYIPSIYEVMAK